VNDNTIRSLYRSTIAASVVIAMLAGCGPSDAPDLAHAKHVASTCPKGGHRVAALVASDESGSRRGSTAQPVQQAVIRDVAERTAICGGHLRVAVFAGSVVTVPVYDADLQLDGATDNARLRKVPKVVDDVMGQINEAQPKAIQQLPDGATDIVVQHQLAAEYRSQLVMDGRYHLESTVLTDGIQTAQVNLEDPSLTTDQAKELATTVTVPDLSGSDVRVIGIGRKADGEQLPTPYVEALRAFHLAVCTRTNAAECVAVTDAAGA
jgi:hypothetical protein